MIAYATPFTQESLSPSGVTHAFGLAGSWAPEKSGWVPAVSVGWGLNSSDTDSSGEVSSSQSWTVGLSGTMCSWPGIVPAWQWASPFLRRTCVVAAPADGQFIWEWWYKFQVTDTISITPALFYLCDPWVNSHPKAQPSSNWAV